MRSGMHYTSVPNILKLPESAVPRRTFAEKAGRGRQKCPEASEPAQPNGEDPGIRSGLRAPATFWSLPTRKCGRSRAEDQRDGDASRARRSDIPLTNFRGIELRDFPAEIARLALIIAEYPVRRALPRPEGSPSRVPAAWTP